jgi:methionyl-tRNA formyltransferase
VRLAPRIGFAGTPEFAVPALEALAASGAQIPIVLTQPDRPAGRGQALTSSAVKAAAARLGLSVVQPPTLKGIDLRALGAAPDLMVVIAYGLLLPSAVLRWPTRGCINLHASLLPRWRGAAPIQHALLAGDQVTGVSVMQMDEGLDTGPVYARHALDIAPHETAGTLHDRLAALAAGALVAVLPEILMGRVEPQPQDRAHATYAPKIAKAEAMLDWRRSAIELERRVRAFNPWPIAEGRLVDGRRLRIWDAQAIAQTCSAAPGTITAAGRAGIDVATGVGQLRIVQLQAPGTRAMDAAAYLAAHSLAGAAFAC